VTAPAADASTDTGGTVAITTTFSYVAQLCGQGVAIVPLSPASTSADTSSQTVTVSFPVTGGDGDIAVFSGQVDLGGTLDVVNANNGDLLTMNDLQLNLQNGTIDGTPAGSSTSVPLFYPSGNIVVGGSASSDSITASALDVDPTGATYLDSALGTSAFTAGQTIGTLSGNWTLTQG
jgi:hypothetical protein